MVPKNKKGSHVGFAISFIVFVGFILFLYSLVQPSSNLLQEKENILLNVQEKILEESTSNVTTFSLYSDSGCSTFNLEEYGIVTIDNNFDKIRFSEEGNFGRENPSCTPEASGELGLVRTEEHFFESKILSLISEYDENYDGIKERYSIPLINDFRFDFEYSNGTSVGVEIKEISTSTYAGKFPVEYIDQNGEISLGFLKVVVW